MVNLLFLKRLHRIKLILYFLVVLCCHRANFSFACEWNKNGAHIFLSKSISAGNFQCLCSKTENFDPPLIQIPPENFSSMVILDLLIDTDVDEHIKSILIQKIKSERGTDSLYTFFTEKALLPPDVDTTALAYIALAKAQGKEPNLSSQALDITILNVDAEGLIEVYVDPQRANRIDAVVCANALYFIYLYGRNEEAKLTEDFIYKTLATKAYKDGTRYYPSEDMFLYIVSRLLDFPSLHKKFAPLLYQGLKERINVAHTPLELAMRIICAKKLGISDSSEKEKLAQCQEEDGGWPACIFYKKGSTSDFFGSREITTAFAIQALSEEKN